MQQLSDSLVVCTRHRAFGVVV